MSEIRNLIDEYRQDAVFQRNQASQWRTLAVALALQVEGSEMEWTIESPELESASAYTLEAIQTDKNGIRVTLTKTSDAS